MSLMPSMRFSLTRFGDLLDQALLFNLIRDLVDDDRLAVALADILEVGAGG